MTPGARVQAAIECLEQVLEGAAAERVLTSWARGARYAGSKDRAAVRDHVYDVLRRKKSCAAHGGGNGARALMIGLLRARGEDPADLFTGIGHAPAELNPSEAGVVAADISDPLELPDWLIPVLQARFGEELVAQLAPLGQRAEVFLRVNRRKANTEQALQTLAEDGITATPTDLAEYGLRVDDGARRIRNASAYRNGLVELQDAASQAAMETIPLHKGMKILDYCAGGGGKTLALAGRGEADFFAHDANPGRMRDLPVRAQRAGVKITCLEHDDLAGQGPFDLVLCDVPCSGSGTWRRDPDAKWRFAPERLDELNAVQDGILERAQQFVAQGGMLVYATCSLLPRENQHRISAFLSRNPSWQQGFDKSWTLLDGADGFFVSHLIRKS